jgi:hypothetical protein
LRFRPLRAQAIQERSAPPQIDRMAGFRREKATDMTMAFPNRSRSYDAARSVVRFWGRDRSKESWGGK